MGTTTQRIGLLILIMAIPIIALAQEKTIPIDVIDLLGKDETTRLFVLSTNKGDQYIEALNALWGAPTESSAGKTKWTEVSLAGLGDDLVVLLAHGLFEIKKKSAMFKPYKNDVEKALPLAERQNRQLQITVCSRDEKNIINSEEKEGIVARFLTSITETSEN